MLGVDLGVRPTKHPNRRHRLLQAAELLDHTRCLLMQELKAYFQRMEVRKMFEQSIVETRGASKPWMLVAMTGQIAAAALALAIPLLHPEVLNAPRMLIAIAYRTPEPPPPEIHVARSSTVPRSGGAALPTTRQRVFREPASIPSGLPVIIDAPGLQFDTASTGGPGINVGPGIQLSTGDAFPAAPAAKAPPAVKEQPAPIKQIRPGGDVQDAKVLRRILPVYPPLAKSARIQGHVRLEGIIARDGTIQQLRVLSGHPLLVQAALDAVRQWRYKPTHLNGEPVEVIAPIDVNFILSN